MAMYKITFKDNKFIFINAVSASEARYKATEEISNNSEEFSTNYDNIKSTELSAPFMSIQK